MINFKVVDGNNSEYMDRSLVGNLNIFQTPAWLQYISEFQKAKPIIAAVKSDGDFLGYFTGLLTHRFGLKILGSPFRGWLTYFMGFNLLPNAPKDEILKALPRFAFDDLHCHYLEVIDPNLTPVDWVDLSYKVEYLHYYAIDISKSEEDLFNAMRRDGRGSIRKSIKNGVFIEEAFDLDFADEYYSQYENVLAKQGLSPTYSLKSVRKLVEYLLPTGNLLLLRARNPEGACIATGIFLSYNKIGIAWGTASWSQYQHLRPNEPLVWYAMKKLKTKGVQLLHRGGKSEDFKEKLGAHELQLCRLMNTKYKLLGNVIYPLLSPKNDLYRNILLKRISS